MPKAALFFAAVIFLAAGSFSPSFASKCYGLDPCYACRNCNYCMHCNSGGGTCGVCGGGKSVSKPRPSLSKTPAVPSDLPTNSFAFTRRTIRKPVFSEETSKETRFPAAAPQFERRCTGETETPSLSQEASASAELPKQSLDLSQFPFDPYTGLPNPNYRGKRTRGSSDFGTMPDASEEGHYSSHSSIRYGQTIPYGGTSPYLQPSPYGQLQPQTIPLLNPAYPVMPSYSGSSGYTGGSSGTQHVSGYYRKDGTYVHSYTRRARSR